MAPFPTDLTRRDALAVLGSAAAGLAARKFPAFPQQASSDRVDNSLPAFSEKSRAILRSVLADPNYSGQIPVASAFALSQHENFGPEKLLLALLPLAQSYSQAPISDFHVGVIVRGASGALYTGANIEIPGQCLGFSVHAEQAALANAYMHSESAVTAVGVGGAPCGHCRQFIEEMSPDGEILIITPQNGVRKLVAILPEPFSPKALGMRKGAFPIREAKLSLVKDSSDALAHPALDAASKAYAPYSKSPSGVAIRSTSGRIYRGSYIENVAFNPSLSPLQVALVGLIAAGESYTDIQAVTLVEVQGAKISQKAATEAVLGTFAPNSKLEVVLARA